MNPRPGSTTPQGSGLAAILILLALAAMFADSRGGGLLAPVRQALGTGLYPLQYALNWPVAQINGIDGYFDDIDQLRRDNHTLRTVLTQQAGELAGVERLQRENRMLRELAGLAPRIPRPGIVAEVRVSGRAPHSRRRLIDKGSQHGVAAGQPVLDPFGVIGQITRVYPFHSEMTLLTDPAISVPVRDRRSGLNLIAFGAPAPARLELRFQTADADIRAGDLLQTSGLDGLYPPGLPVGRVAGIEPVPNEPFVRITIDPAGNVDDPRMVLILQADEIGRPDTTRTDGNVVPDPTGTARATATAQPAVSPP